MIGIKAYGAYLPKYLLPRELISQAWDFPSVPGNKAIANIPKLIILFVTKSIEFSAKSLTSDGCIDI